LDWQRLIVILYSKQKILHLARQWLNIDNEIITSQMSSIIEGFNYDIFISYRQKDDKGDRWVSEFFEALKTLLRVQLPGVKNRKISLTAKHSRKRHLDPSLFYPNL
jgi:hypothetical protein